MEVSNRAPIPVTEFRDCNSGLSAEKGLQMQDTLTVGTVILKEDVRLPEGLKVETEPYARGWKVLKNMDAYGFDRAIRGAGWNFLSLAGTIKVSAIGTKGSSRLDRGIRKLTARTSTGKFNALEITEARSKSFLGVPYVNISARSRHVQQSIFLVPDRDVQIRSKQLSAHPTPAPAFLHRKGLAGETTIGPSI
jgi:hypothetical protein